MSPASCAIATCPPVVTSRLPSGDSEDELTILSPKSAIQPREVVQADQVTQYSGPKSLDCGSVPGGIEITKISVPSATKVLAAEMS
jgi:hypothetical protein